MQASAAAARAALVALLLLAFLPVVAHAQEPEPPSIVVLAVDEDAASARMPALVESGTVYQVSTAPDVIEVAGLWLLGASPSGLCPTPSLTADEVVAALADAQRRIDEVEVEEGQARLSALRNRLGCLDSPADPESLWSLHFLEAVTAHFAAGAEAAMPALERALAVRPGAAYDDSYPPDLRDAYLAAQQGVMSAGWARILPMGELEGQAVLVDGTEVPAAGLEVIPGEHLLQLRSADGVLRGGSLVLEGGGLLVVAAPRKLARALTGLDRGQQEALASWLGPLLAAPPDARIWIADQGREFVQLGEDGGLVRPAATRQTDGFQAPLLQIAVGGGAQRIHHWSYGMFAVDVSVRLVGPLRLRVFARPAIGVASESAPGQVPVVVPFGLGPQLRLPGPVHFRVGALFQMALDSNESPEGDTRLIAGLAGTVGADIPLPNSPLALRPSFEGGVLGAVPWPFVRGLVEVVIELGGER
jgi:hypothetical protein